MLSKQNFLINPTDHLGSQTWVLFRNAWDLFVDFTMQTVLFFKYSNLKINIAGRLGQGVYFLTHYRSMLMLPSNNVSRDLHKYICTNNCYDLLSIQGKKFLSQLSNLGGKA